MKHSINKIFNNLSSLLIIITLSVGLITILVLEQNSSYSKINNLKNQKELIESLVNLQKKDIELALIQFNSKSTQLHNEIEKLRKLNKYDYTGKFLLGNSQEFLSDLDKLSELTTNFNESAHKYYIKNLRNIKEKNRELKIAFYSINTFIDSMIIKNISYNEDKFHMLEKITFFSFTLTLLTAFWYRKRLNSIYTDILHLYAINNKKDYDIFSEEADAIKLRMGRKPPLADNLAMLDPVTQINNYNGMMNSYNHKKEMKNSNFISVTIFEIDNFSKQKRAFSQEFTQAILKKIAFTISLHEQATDVIARTDYNQFTIILSRTSKEQSFKDVDIIRQSISEIKFNEPNGDSVTITVSGGFMIKPNNLNLEKAIKKAKEVLAYAKEHGKNSISQLRDIAEHKF